MRLLSRLRPLLYRRNHVRRHQLPTYPVQKSEVKFHPVHHRQHRLLQISIGYSNANSDLMQETFQLPGGKAILPNRDIFVAGKQ